MAAGRGCCTICVTAWKSLRSSAESHLRLLLPPLPLLRNASLDARPVPGGGHAIEGGRRRGLRGGFTGRSPASTHPQLMKPPPWLSWLPLVKPSHQQLPRRCQQLYPCRRSQLHHLGCSVSHRSRPRHCWCYRRSRHRHRHSRHRHRRSRHRHRRSRHRHRRSRHRHCRSRHRHRRRHLLRRHPLRVNEQKQ